jgi:hypothetical protein
MHALIALRNERNEREEAGGVKRHNPHDDGYVNVMFFFCNRPPVRREI